MTLDVVWVVVTAFWVMLPAYLPNNIAVVVGGGRPLDGGRSWRGRRLLGDGKTWRGTIGGIVGGALVSAVLIMVHPAVQTLIGQSLPLFPVAAGITLPVGAILGDIAGSFVKRRTGRDRGASFPVVDQLDFVAGALVLTALWLPVWFQETFTVGVVITIIVLTPVLHRGTNVIGYLLGLKQEPY